MKIKYDKKADAKYISIRKGKISYTKKDKDWLLFDCSKKGEVLGVEILNASKNSISVYTIKERFIGCEVLKTSLVSSSKEIKDNARLTAKLPNNFAFRISSFEVQNSGKVFA